MSSYGDLDDWVLKPSYTVGAIAALESFAEEVRRNRGRIENENESTVDVILDLLECCRAQLESELDP